MSKTEREFLNRYYLAVKNYLDNIYNGTDWNDREKYLILKQVAVDYQDWLNPSNPEKDFK